MTEMTMRVVAGLSDCQNGYLAAVSKLLHCRQLFPAAGMPLTLKLKLPVCPNIPVGIDRLFFFTGPPLKS